MLLAIAQAEDVDRLSKIFSTKVRPIFREEGHKGKLQPAPPIGQFEA